MSTTLLPSLHCFTCPCCCTRQHSDNVSAVQTSRKSIVLPSKLTTCRGACERKKVGRRELCTPEPFCCPTINRQQPVEQTDVVVIGNGPSGICMSYVLAGHWPYYTGLPHSDELLTMRLQSEGTDRSLILQDLSYLCDGLEGRSSNPVALLVDALSNPDADFGANLPSLLRWERHPERTIDHVVLGQSDEGGIWQTIDDDIQTLSLGDWMELPDMPFQQFRDSLHSEKTGNTVVGKPELRSRRASAYEVRKYYSQYVDAKGLRQYFHNRSLVTSIEHVCSDVGQPDCESGEVDPMPCCKKVWEVRGRRDSVDPASGLPCFEEFCYHAQSVVLASGAFDIPNVLRVPGENQSFVLHSLSELDSVICHNGMPENGDPVVVVGAGLCAADAILRVRAAGIPVAHVFRHGSHDPTSVFRHLPAALYPEYDEVHKLMKSSGSKSASWQYRSYPASSIVEFTSNNEVVMRSDNSDDQLVIRASYAVVLIGSRPNLSFLNGDENRIGRVPGVYVDGKRNPFDVDAFTYQSNRRSGLYAIGPLVGDNFVRFLRGGAVGVAAHMWSLREESARSTSSEMTKL